MIGVGAAFDAAATRRTEGEYTLMDPQHIDYLMKLAAISLSFVGFSTIVVALRQALGSRLSSFHLLLVRFFVETGLTVTAFSLLPPMLNAAGFETLFVWRSTSGAAALLSVVYLVSYILRRRRVEAGSIPLRIYVNYTISVVAILGLVLNAGGWQFTPRGAPYIIALTWFLLQSGLVFLQALPVFLAPSTDD
jgi:hypothetical protein